MYFEEQRIDGILCHKGTPEGDWIPYTLEAMAIALTAERGMSKKHRAAWLAADLKLRAIQEILRREA